MKCFLSVHELLVAASVCSSWRNEAFRAIKNRTGIITICFDEGIIEVFGQVIKVSIKALMRSLASLQKIYNVKVMISSLNTVSSQ